MSECITTHFPSHTGEGNIAAHTWLPDCPESEIKGVIQFVHGMSEYVKRFDHVAKCLNGLGYVFSGEDHAGHGESLVDPDHTGYFAAEDGWNKIILDTFELHKQLKARYPDKKHILYGHSMGSFMARACASRYPGEFDAFIFSGTAGHNPAIGIGKALVKAELRRHGGFGHSELLNKLAMGGFVTSVKNRRTNFDWLSRDEKVVDDYIADPLCGFSFRCAGYRDLFDGLDEVSRRDWAKKVPNVPIYIFSGDHDPVGNMGKGVREVADRLISSGHTHVVMQLYEGGRHEMHNETNSEEVLKGIEAFLRGAVC